MRNIIPEPAHDIRIPIRNKVFLLITFNKHIAIKVYIIEANAMKNLRSKWDFVSVNLKLVCIIYSKINASKLQENSNNTTCR